MGVRRFEELIAWQLADELHRQVVAFSDGAPANEDRDFCNQICGSPRHHYTRPRITSTRHETGASSPKAKHLELIRLTLRALKANTRLQQALRQNKGNGS
jgi:hypothetical protein